MSGYVDKNAQRVYHVLQQAESIRRKLVGFTYEKLLENVAQIDSILYNITVIGEAVRAMDDEFKAAHVDIPWRSIVGMRNILVHQYDDVDFSLVWEVVTVNLPELVEKLEEIYKGFEFPDDFTPPPLPSKG